MKKPTFGALAPKTASAAQRPEIGAIWKRTAKNNKSYLNLKISTSKEKLLSLIKEEEGVVTLNLVAFLNDAKKGDDKKPEYRIFEERKV